MQKAKLYNAKKMRLIAGLTVKEVSEKLKITKQAISLYETGKCLPTPKHLWALADLYGCNVSDLF